MTEKQARQYLSEIGDPGNARLRFRTLVSRNELAAIPTLIGVMAADSGAYGRAALDALDSLVNNHPKFSRLERLPTPALPDEKALQKAGQVWEDAFAIAAITP